MVKERFFTTPLALSNMNGTTKRSGGQDGDQGWSKKQKKGGRGKGSAKGRGKGSKGEKGKGKGRNGCAFKTPEGKLVCFDFNNPDVGCTKKDCQYSNVCGNCFKAGHAMYNCRGKVNKGETHGSGAGAEE